MALPTRFYHLILLMLFAAACSENEPLITELGSGLPIPNFQGSFQKTIPISLTPQAVIVEGNCDPRINDLLMSVDAVNFMSINEASTLSDVDVECVDGTFGFKINSTADFLNFSQAPVGLEKKIYIKGLTKIGATKPSVISLVVSDDGVPSVVSVSSSLANGTYGVGEVISVQVQFSEAVNVSIESGTPTLLLEMGATDKQAQFASGNGSNMLTFTYTIEAGDGTSDLDYASTSALALNGGVIKDAGNNIASLGLPELGASVSLGGSKNIVIDTTAPVVTQVTSSTPNGPYGVGAVISVQVEFSEVVSVTGTPTLLLEMGATDKQAQYASGSGSNTLTFTYTVAAGDSSADLDYTSTSALALNGGVLKDAGLFEFFREPF